MLESLLRKKLVVFTGKGGVGKSLVAASFGLYAARQGLRVLLVENNDQGQLGPLLGSDDSGHNETKVKDNLHIINLDASNCLEEYVVKRLGQAKLFDKVFSHSIVRSFLNTLPGLAESMILGRIYYTVDLQEPAPYDLVIFDAPASGHMHSLMTTPDAVINSGMGGPFVKEVTRVREFLSDSKKCTSVVVTVPEDLVISESLEFIPLLSKESPIGVFGVVVNRAVDPDSRRDIDDLLQNANKIPDLKVIADYAAKKYEQSEKNQKNLISSLEVLVKDKVIKNYMLLPEFGSIEEPLTSQFAEEFLQEMKVD